MISQRNNLNSRKRITILDTSSDQIIAAAYYLNENSFGAAGSLGQDLFIPYLLSSSLQIAKVAFSTLGSVAWMDNEVLDATFFNLTVYTGPLVTRLTDNSITYAAWTNSSSQNETAFPINLNPSVTTSSAANAFTSVPSIQTFEVALENKVVSV